MDKRSKIISVILNSIVVILCITATIVFYNYGKTVATICFCISSAIWGINFGMSIHRLQLHDYISFLEFNKSCFELHLFLENYCKKEDKNAEKEENTEEKKF